MRNTNDRVRENTAEEINIRLDREMADRVREYAGRTENDLTKRIGELEREWDIERLLQTNAAAIALSGLGLGLSHSRKWLVLPGIVLPFLLQHAVQGWCPPVPVLRRMGFRSRKEIDEEKYALKYLRGDFADSEGPPPTAALRSVNL
jgi:hypothetical protein